MLSHKFKMSGTRNRMKVWSGWVVENTNSYPIVEPNCSTQRLKKTFQTILSYHILTADRHIFQHVCCSPAFPQRMCQKPVIKRENTVPTLVEIIIKWLGRGRKQECTAAAAAKSLQSCPTLCDPVDGSPPGSPIPGILQARTLEWVAISFSNAWKWKVKVKLLSRAWLLATPWTAAYQAPPPSMGFSRQEDWSGLPLPSPSVLQKIIHRQLQDVKGDVQGELKNIVLTTRRSKAASR